MRGLVKSVRHRPLVERHSFAREHDGLGFTGAHIEGALGIARNLGTDTGRFLGVDDRDLQR